MTVALVTGASSGIGEAIAIRLATRGIRTYGAARNVDRMARLKAVGGRPLLLDLSDPASIDACVLQVAAEAGGIDILINGAGTALYGAIEDVGIDAARR